MGTRRDAVLGERREAIRAAAERQLEIIGEAAGKLSDEFAQQRPHLPLEGEPTEHQNPTTAISSALVPLSGPIPDSLGDLTNLWILSLEDNQLSGPVPDSLGDLSDVWILSLEGNDLTGPLPRGREEPPEWFDSAIRDHTSRITPDQWAAYCLNNNH